MAFRKIHNKTAAFFSILGRRQYKPERDFLAEFLPAMFVAGSTVVGDIQREMTGLAPSPHQSGTVEYRALHNRITRHLASRRLKARTVLGQYHTLMAPGLMRNNGEGVNVAVDETDYGKPFSRPGRPNSMEGTSRVRDASVSTREKAILVRGYPGVTIEATLPNGVQVPIIHHLFTREAHPTEERNGVDVPIPDEITGLTAYKSDHETQMVLLKQAAQLVGHRALWVFDSGYWGTEYLADFQALGIRHVVRVPVNAKAGALTVRTEEGVEISVSDLANLMPLPHVQESADPKGGSPLTIRSGIVKVFLRDSKRKGAWQTEPRSIIASTFNDCTTRFVLFASEWIDDSAATTDLLRREYKKRFLVETSHKWSKEEHGWGYATERFQVRRLVRIQRLILFAMLCQGLVAHLLLAEKEEMGRVIAGARAPKSKFKDPRWRAASALRGLYVRGVRQAYKERQYAVGVRRTREKLSDHEMLQMFLNRKREHRKDQREMERRGLPYRPVD